MTTQPETASSDRDHAREALERVCARGDFDAARDYYGPDFIDHVNEMEYRGQESIRQSVGLYLLVFTDLRIRVEDQIAEGDRVVSRWTAEGTNRGRHIRLPGITISQIADGKIVEDWTSSDNLGLLRQLGLGRTLLLSVDWLVAEVKRRR
jgi:predicted ester cyclase